MLDWNTIEDRMMSAARDHLGQTATYTPAATGIAESVRMVYHRRSVRADAIGEIGLRMQTVEVFCRAADLSQVPAVNDKIAIGGQSWRVAGVPQSDGQAGLVISLKLDLSA